MADEQATSAAEQYVNSLRALCERSKTCYLHCGEHYKALARFLEKQSPLNTQIGYRIVFHHVIIHTHYVNGDTPRFDRFDGTQDPDTSMSHVPATEANMAQFVFLRGFVGAKWLATLGTHYRIDPEFLRRHLDFLQPTSFNDLPPLPTTWRTAGRLRLTTVCVRETPLTSSEVQARRLDELQRTKRFQQQLGSTGTYGATIIRTYSVLSELHVALGQDISFHVKKKKSGGWTVIVWSDCGRPLHQLQGAPWCTKGPTNLDCRPIIQHVNKLALNTVEAIIATADPIDDRHSFGFQNASHLPNVYGSSLDARIMKLDALYGLSELFALSAASENQFVNTMQQLISETAQLSFDQEQRAQESLRYFKTVLDARILRIREMLAFLQLRGGPNWPQATDPADQAVVEAQMMDLCGNLEHLLERASGLTASCLEGITTIVNISALNESKTARQQAQNLNRLSILAFFFLPLSFTTSAFGMNVRELGVEDGAHLRTMIGVTIIFLVVSIGLCFWHTLSLCVIRTKRTFTN
ncbi:hypothetical protein BDV96DRAFT_647527 [Lophiotrema nucula]|uniref:Uncharacterized protein n=1 Tax=Lophiotrema nucula TaxID=690887 RepID=A0A6A5Z3J0_9PLEO|nr:hypothetical protein BDV96DRAFT_647527 [Lophiotrema nucula]